MNISKEAIIAGVRDEREMLRKIYGAVLEIEKTAKREKTKDCLIPLKQYLRNQDIYLTNWLLDNDVVEGEVVKSN